jgi:exonuclease SbcD
MRLLHTSDWHLGHVLHEHERLGEHAAFLEWLGAQLVAQEADALLVAGDVFDTANPSAEAQRLFYDFVVRARAAQPHLALVIIGGNHDSPARLDAPGPLLRSLGVHVVGGMPSDPASLVVPLVRRGETLAQVAAVPFLRVADLPQLPERQGADRLIEGVRAVYAAALARARGQLGRGQHLLAMGHCYLAGGLTSERSERKILVGNQHALPADLFPDDVAYVALGHLHRAQHVAREGIRYAGSPLPMSLDEAGYAHQVVRVDLDGGSVKLEALRVPRTADILRVPATGALPPDALLDALSKLPARDPAQPEHTRPFLHAAVQLDGPEPTLQARVHEALEGKAARLCWLQRVTAGTGQALGDARPGLTLRDLSPEEVFRRRFTQAFGEAEPAPSLLADFHELVQAAQAGEAP